MLRTDHRPWQFGPMTVTIVLARGIREIDRDLLAFARLLESRAEHDRVAGAFPAAFVDDAWNRLGRGDDERDVGRFREIGHGLVGLEALDLGMRRRYRIDPTLVSMLEQHAHERVAGAPRDRRGADHCDASRTEQAVESL